MKNIFKHFPDNYDSRRRKFDISELPYCGQTLRGEGAVTLRTTCRGPESRVATNKFKKSYGALKRIKNLKLLVPRSLRTKDSP